LLFGVGSIPLRELIFAIGVACAAKLSLTLSFSLSKEISHKKTKMTIPFNLTSLSFLFSLYPSILSIFFFSLLPLAFLSIL